MDERNWLKNLDWRTILAGLAITIVGGIILLILEYGVFQLPHPWRWVILLLASIAVVVGLIILLTIRWKSVRRILESVFRFLGNQIASAWQWIRAHWRFITGFIVLSVAAYGLFALTGAWWATLLSVAMAAGAALIARQDLLHPKSGLPGHHHRIFEDNFECGLDEWEIPAFDWITNMPQHTPAGIELTHIEPYPEHPLEKVLLLRHGAVFRDGVIECEVYLTANAMFDVVVRGNIGDGEFYMARLDSRSGPRETDSIVFKPAGGNWYKCNHDSTHRTIIQRWTRMRIEACGPKIHLYNNGELVNQIDNAEITSGRIALFAEGSRVHVRRVRVTYTDT